MFVGSVGKAACNRR